MRPWPRRWTPPWRSDWRALRMPVPAGWRCWTGMAGGSSRCWGRSASCAMRTSWPATALPWRRWCLKPGTCRSFLTRPLRTATTMPATGSPKMPWWTQRPCLLPPTTPAGGFMTGPTWRRCLMPRTVEAGRANKRRRRRRPKASAWSLASRRGRRCPFPRLSRLFPARCRVPISRHWGSSSWGRRSAAPRPWPNISVGIRRLACRWRKAMCSTRRIFRRIGPPKRLTNATRPGSNIAGRLQSLAN